MSACVTTSRKESALGEMHVDTLTERRIALPVLGERERNAVATEIEIPRERGDHHLPLPNLRRGKRYPVRLEVGRRESQPHPLLQRNKRNRLRNSSARRLTLPKRKLSVIPYSIVPNSTYLYNQRVIQATILAGALLAAQVAGTCCSPNFYHS